VEALAPVAVDRVRITTLMDNSADLLAHHAKAARDVTFRGERVPTSIMEGGTTFDGLVAEHGYSALVELWSGTRRASVLYDAGLSPHGLRENMRRLEVDPRDLQAVVMSHGHFDHTTGLEGIIRDLGSVGMPVVLHPDFWNRRRIRIDGTEPIELPTPSRRSFEEVGVQVTEGRRPSFMFDAGLLVTGEVDRTTEYEKGFPTQQAFWDGHWHDDELTLDDQALVINVAGKGLVVMSGCGHAGIVNIVRYAQRLTGVDAVHAVIGGFHLSGAPFEPIIDRTVDALAAVSPDVVVPAHCTGWKAQLALADRLPDAVLLNAVGATFDLAAAPG